METDTHPGRTPVVAAALAAIVVTVISACTPAAGPPATGYPWHTEITSTTFWVGEILDPNASDGSQVVSTYDIQWMAHYGGCDGVVIAGDCRTEARTAATGFAPQHMTPTQNPFYLDLPFDDVNNAAALAQRASVVPWANAPGYAGHATDPTVSLMKNRWVRLRRAGQICYGQIEDAGPGAYDDAGYVFGHDDQRPANTKFNGAGLDVSPALNGCLHFTDLNGQNDTLDWQFVDDADVPPGPWRTIITTQGLTPGQR
jgi:hypothetical protein